MTNKKCFFFFFREIVRSNTRNKEQNGLPTICTNIDGLRQGLMIHPKLSKFIKICAVPRFPRLFHFIMYTIQVADRSRNRVFRDCNSFRVPTETVALPGNIFGGVYVPGKYGKRVGFSRMLLQRGNVFIFKNNNCIISNLLELLFVHNYII